MCPNCSRLKGYGAIHGCAKCRAHNLLQVDKAIFDIKMSMKRINYKPQTSGQMRDRANRLRNTATGIKLHKGEVNDEYR